MPGIQEVLNKYLLNEQMGRNDKMLKKQGHDGMLDTLILNDPMMRLKKWTKVTAMGTQGVRSQGKKEFQGGKIRVNY